ncbi:uncharacterized protein [Temnothorax longispinosus]|uniref:uncharacterized protein isoform X2 n=1 Tax=Temnothorax longispinosus TaxID=300112 RepID=UPI003A994834
MDIEEEEELLALLILILGINYIIKKRRSFRWINRKYWVHTNNIRRPNQGDFDQLFQELKDDPQRFFRYTRMSLCVFNELLEMMKPFLTKTNHRALIPEQRLVITLRYLATGDQVLSIALAYRVGESTARNIIKETCYLLVKVLAPIYLQVPTTEKWLEICHGFWTDWNFPNCCGAVDGKHVQIQAPPNSVDCGAYGNSSDSTIFEISEFGKAIQTDTLNLPKGKANLPESNIATPCYFVGDAAFQLSKNMMRPYPGRQLEIKKKIFNYRLSRARRIIENTFGIFASRWRVFRKPILMHPKNVDKIVMAAVCLHNYLKTKNDIQPIANRIYCPLNFVDTEETDGNIIPGMWRNENSECLEQIRPSTAHRATNEAYKQRDAIAEYLMTPAGEVSWQKEYVSRGLNNCDNFNNFD